MIEVYLILFSILEDNAAEDIESTYLKDTMEC